MAGVLKLDIVEPAETLKALLDDQQSAQQRSKVQVLWWLKTAQAKQVKHLSQLSGYHRTTISGWLSQYRQGGLSQLLAVRRSSGRPRAIAGEMRVALSRALAEPEGFESYQEVQYWLAAVHGLKLPYKTVHKTVRYGLKAKLKRSRPVSEKQQPGAVEAFEETLEG